MVNPIRQARDARGWTSARLNHELRLAATRAGVKTASATSLRVMISQWENGRQTPDRTYQMLLQMAFDLPAEAWDSPTRRRTTRLRAAWAHSSAATSDSSTSPRACSATSASSMRSTPCSTTSPVRVWSSTSPARKPTSCAPWPSTARSRRCCWRPGSRRWPDGCIRTRAASTRLCAAPMPRSTWLNVLAMRIWRPTTRCARATC